MAALAVPGASAEETAALADDPVLKWALAAHATFEPLECRVTTVTAGAGAPTATTNSAQSSAATTTANLTNGLHYANWSGWEDDGPGTGNIYYNSVGWEWRVPAPEAGVITTSRDVSIWPGIGSGHSTSDVLAQAGSQTTAGPAGVQSTYAWTEAYPVEPSEVEILSMPVNVGDLMGVTVTTDSYLNQITFVVGNQTTGQVTVAHDTLTSGSVSGQQAEFIVERPGLPTGQFSELGQFDPLYTYYASATTVTSPSALGVRHWASTSSWSGETSNSVTMTACGGSPTLAYVGYTPTGQGNFEVTWQNHGSLESC